MSFGGGYPPNNYPPQGGYPQQPYGAPGYGAPGGAPGYGAPGYGAPGGAPGYGAPGYGAPGGAPGYGAPGYGAPGYGAPGGAPGYGAPGYGAPGHGAPGHGAPGHGAPGHGAPGYGAPGGAPGYGAPGYGAPGHGAPGYGAPGHGAPGPYGASPYPGAPTPGFGGAPTPYPGAPTPGFGAPGSVTVSTTTTSIPINFMPVFNYPHCDPHTDARKLYKAMKGLGTDDSVLIDIITHRNKFQLEQIQQAYLSEHKKTIDGDIKGDTSGNYRQLLLDLMKPVIGYKIENLKKAVTGVGTREVLLIDVLTQSSNVEIDHIKRQYPELEHEIKGDTSGNFRTVLKKLMQGTRQEITHIDDVKAEHVAKELHEAGEFRLGTNDSKFVDIFTAYSPYFLDRVDFHYRKLFGHSLTIAIEKETSGYYRDTLIALTKPPDVYFADRLAQAMRGLGTDDWGLIYIFAVHDKAQLKYIAKVFANRGHGNLAAKLEKDTSGNYRRTLMAILG